MGYPACWSGIARREKQEAGWRCVRCGHPDRPEAAEPRGRQPCDEHCSHPQVQLGQPPDRKRILTVHHLDGDKSNLRWWNLLALCQSCHLSVQARVDPSQTYRHPHTPWFRPYVAGYYAERVAGIGPISRQEALVRLPELLAIGQPHLRDLYHDQEAA